MNPVSNKKLLILGATANEISLVKRAQELGVYVIVTDNHLDYQLSPAKMVANEAWDISWSDLDTLECKCRENQVDGVTAGYSEFRVENQILLCQRLGLPCYITMEQLDITRDKVKFKETCRKYDVPVVREYSAPEEVVSYPVIVKPVDRAGSIGISIATNREQLEKAYSYAMDLSVSKHVIIEDYIHDQTKVDVYYAVENGRITILSTCDTINAAENGFERVVQSAWLYPHRYLPAFLEKADAKLRGMIRGMGIQNGCIFFSGFVNEKKEYQFFECGFRMEGAHQYEYTARSMGTYFLDLFLFHALTGDVKDVPKRTNTDDRLKCAVINLYAKAGTIGQISGMEKIAEMENCTHALVRARTGEVCSDKQAILTKIGMFAFADRNEERLCEAVSKAYGLFCTTDAEGQDMVYDRIDVHAICDWWK